MTEVKRIASLPSFRKYEDGLRKAIVAYLKKSGCKDTLEGILTDIRLGCHSPDIYCCVISQEEVVRGFAFAFVERDHRGKTIVVDHFYLPNMTMAVRIYDWVVEKLCDSAKVERDKVWFVTYRNPEVWLRYMKKVGREHEVTGWMLRRKET